MRAMKLAGWLLAFSVVVAPAWAQSLWPADVPLPQDALLPMTLMNVIDRQEDISLAMVVVQMGRGEENPRWLMSQTQLQVLLNKLKMLPEKPLPEDDIWPKLKPLDRSYKGMTVIFQTVDNKRFMPMQVFEGRMATLEGTLVAPDFARHLEYWLFGTARVRRDQMLGVSVLPVISFEQCRLLGQKVVETTPRQCLLPDNNLLLEVTETPTLKSAKLKDFDGCLKDGQALIYTFPRRCVAAGGRVFTEPPRVYENVPGDAPLAISGTVAKGTISQTMGGLVNPSPTMPMINRGGVTTTSEVVSGSVISGTMSLPLDEAELQKIAPAAGHKPGKAVKKPVWRYEWADFGEK